MRGTLLAVAAVAAGGMVAALPLPAAAQAPVAAGAAVGPGSAAGPGGAAGATSAAPPPANPQPLRISAGAELWSIPEPALRQFVVAGTFSDQRLQRLVANAGWPEEALRAALVKPYSVDLVAMARFLDSAAGQTFLQQQTRAYRPLTTGRNDLRAPALRAAVRHTLVASVRVLL